MPETVLLRWPRSPQAKSLISVDDLLRTRVESAAAQTELPTEAQKKSGKYKKGKVDVQGLPIAIETAKGQERSGKGKDGKPWSVMMVHHYGYIQRTESEADGDAIDVFIGDYPASPAVFIIDQLKDDGTFDEHKVMIGFHNIGEARQGYLACYSPGWQGLGNISPMTMDGFKEWLATGDTGTPVSKPLLSLSQNLAWKNKGLRRVSSKDLSAMDDTRGGALVPGPEHSVKGSEAALSLEQRAELIAGMMEKLSGDRSKLEAALRSEGYDPANFGHAFRLWLSRQRTSQKTMPGESCSCGNTCADCQAEQLAKALGSYASKSTEGEQRGTCKPGERADLTGCTPATHTGTARTRKPVPKPPMVAARAGSQATNEEVEKLAAAGPGFYKIAGQDVVKMNDGTFYVGKKKCETLGDVQTALAQGKAPAGKAPRQDSGPSGKVDKSASRLANRWKLPAQTTSDYAKLLGMADAQSVEVKELPDAEQPTIQIKVKGEGYSATRHITYENGQLVMENRLIEVEDKGKGLGTRILSQQVEELSKAGFAKIKANAAGPLYAGHQSSLNGYYTWPRLGYDAQIPSELKRDMPTDLAKADTVMKLYLLPGGAEWWKTNGRAIDVEFSLSGNSPSKQVLNAYLEERNRRAAAA